MEKDAAAQRIKWLAKELERHNLSQVRHTMPMLSLENGFTEEDLRDFDDRVKRFLGLPGTTPVSYNCEPKSTRWRSSWSISTGSSASAPRAAT